MGVARYKKRYAIYLGGHDELVVDDVVWGEPHPEESAGGVEVTGHARPAVHILPNALRGRRGEGLIGNSIIWSYLSSYRQEVQVK